MFCSQCGQQLPDDSRFCSTCGAPQTLQQTPSAPIHNASDIKAVAQNFGGVLKNKTSGLFGNLKNLAGEVVAGMQKPAEPQIPTSAPTPMPMPTSAPTPMPMPTSAPTPMPMPTSAPSPMPILTPVPQPVMVTPSSTGQTPPPTLPAAAPSFPDAAQTLPEQEAEPDAPLEVNFMEMDPSPEQPIYQFGGEFDAGEFHPKAENGYWVLTDKRLVFFPFDVYNEEGAKFDYEKQWEARAFSEYIFLRDLHSIHTFNAGFAKSATIYTYSSRNFTANFSNKKYKTLKEELLKLIPDLLIVETTLGTYKPSISKYDPRNPFGIRFNKEYPRGYVLAEVKKLKKDPHGIDDAIAAAKRDGTLPSDWSLVSHGVSQEAPPPGVPCFF
jgi:hypothetical protein